MKKLLMTMVLALAFFFGASVTKTEAANDYSYRHAYKPHVVSQTQWMRARVDNFAPVNQDKLVCVEAFKQSNNAKTHLGCLRVKLAAHGSADGWAMDFDVPTNLLKPGNYRVVYTFQDENGSWHRIKSVHMTVQDGWYQAY